MNRLASKLNETERLVVLLRYHSHLTWLEVAAALDLEKCEVLAIHRRIARMAKRAVRPPR